MRQLRYTQKVLMLASGRMFCVEMNMLHWWLGPLIKIWFLPPSLSATISPSTNAVHCCSRWILVHPVMSQWVDMIYVLVGRLKAYAILHVYSLTVLYIITCTLYELWYIVLGNRGCSMPNTWALPFNNIDIPPTPSTCENVYYCEGRNMQCGTSFLCTVHPNTAHWYNI